MNHIEDMIRDCLHTITFTNHQLKMSRQYEWDEEIEGHKLELKVLKDMIKVLENLKLKYEEKFEVIERDYK